LAIEISLKHFKILLQEAIPPSYIEDRYESQIHWKTLINNSAVRLQWDPDHDLYGNKLARRTIQIGIKGPLLEKFAKDWIISIEDITSFVHQQKAILDSEQLEHLEVIKEQKIQLNNADLIYKLHLD